MRAARRVAPALALALALAVPGCLLSDDTPSDGVELWAARRLWETRGPAEYTVRENVSCFCPCPAAFTLIVREGVPPDVTDVEPNAGTPDGSPEDAARLCARTVDQLFDLLQSHVGEADRFHAEYDPDLGYPTRIEIDPDRRIADEEIRVRLSGLAPLGSE